MTALDPDCRHVVDLELRLLDPAVRKNAEEILALLADDFLEVGASGRTFRKEDVVGLLAGEGEETLIRADGVAVQRLGHDAVMVTYVATKTIDAAVARSYRCSIWQRDQGGQWQLAHHQGTALAPSP